MVKVKCPWCGHVFIGKEGFYWLEDENGDPTVENMTCPKCEIGTEPALACELCPGGLAGKCELEECCACATVNYEDFTVVEVAETNGDNPQDALTFGVR